MAKLPLTFSSSSTSVFSAVPHICSTAIASRLPRKDSPALRSAGLITRARSTEFAPRSSGSAVLSDIAMRTIFADRDAPALARQFVAASRPAHAREDRGVNQPLEQYPVSWGSANSAGTGLAKASQPRPDPGRDRDRILGHRSSAAFVIFRGPQRAGSEPACGLMAQVEGLECHRRCSGNISRSLMGKMRRGQ
jgi:hypothetical protein